MLIDSRYPSFDSIETLSVEVESTVGSVSVSIACTIVGTDVIVVGISNTEEDSTGKVGTKDVSRSSVFTASVGEALIERSSADDGSIETYVVGASKEVAWDGVKSSEDSRVLAS